MKKGVCPKCGSTDVVAIEKPIVTHGMTGNILREHIPRSLFKEAALEHYVCKHCGYLERYIIKEHLKRI